MKVKIFEVINGNILMLEEKINKWLHDNSIHQNRIDRILQTQDGMNIVISIFYY